MLYLVLVIAMLYCAYRVMRARSLLNATIWLAFSSALVAVLLYLLGAPEVAVIELSVGAGLVTVLFVFAFSIVGEATVDEITLIPRPLVWLLVLVGVFVLGWFVFPLPAAQAGIDQREDNRLIPVTKAQAHSEASAVAGTHLARENSGFEHALQFFLGEGFDGCFLDARCGDGFHDLVNPQFLSCP